MPVTDPLGMGFDGVGNAGVGKGAGFDGVGNGRGGRPGGVIGVGISPLES